MTDHYEPPPRQPLVRVEVLLERGVLEDLERIVRHRHGHRSRSAIVREAIDWLRAKEAGWLLRAARQAELRRREAEALARARSKSAQRREREDMEQLVRRALDLIAEGDES